ncbi:MAG: MerR family transcriptional regulator [Acidimicrobiales bacterium]
MGDRAYLSIGEVLSLLKDEFPDITISKIRFLESQGLLDPERTASGYRKFYDPDVDRLRWILRQQREHFLPLKVIKGRLVGGPAGDEALGEEGLGEEGESGGEHPSRSGPLAGGADLRPAPAPEPGPGLEPEATAPAAVANGVDVSAAAAPRAEAPAPVAPTAPAVAPAPQPAAAAPTGGSQRDSMLSPGLTGANLTLEELSAACGLPYERLRELERYGFIAGRSVAGTVYYDEESLVVANLAAGFARFGIEGRHLRIYKNSAEREAGLFEQIVTPLLKQRNPEARRQAVQALEELTQLGQSLRAAVLRQAVRRLSGG